ncbi:cytochrome c [Castellaniella sp. GW247-6E4]|uniref:cytochrome c n=1 Tax=Castellaniella sp. GW247-6E4 TaxID=3140380 RepID=UPI0033154AD1
MQRSRPQRALWLALALILLLGLAAVFLGLFRATSVTEAVARPLSEDEVRELLPRGRQLAMAGDCFGCHSKPEGPRAAGGVALATPFGTLYSTNITPDPEHGIGRYTRADFHRALLDGVAKGGRNLYPAMPYVFTHRTTAADVDALYAYMMSIPPIAEADTPPTGIYRLPVRGFMNFWNLLNFPGRDAVSAPAPAVSEAAPERADQWVRGAYLVEGLAHCAACHTPMNVTMGTDFSRHFQGAVIDGMQAPDIRAETLGRQGFDLDSLTRFLRTGVSPQGSSFAGMYTVTHASTSDMRVEDVEAMAVYLLTGEDGVIVPADAPPRPWKAAASLADSAELTAGRLAYLSACAGCHGLAGEGIPNVAPAMRGNATLINDDPRNFVKVVLEGIPAQRFAGNQRMDAMPGFADQLSDEAIARLTNWSRGQWGGQAPAATEDTVRKLRKAP